MDVILLERIEKLGSIGDVVKVKNGYARNFLLPNGKALRANESNRKVFEANREKIEATNAERRGAAEAESKKIDGARIKLIRQASNAGQLYGSVSARDIAVILTDGGFTASRNQIVLHNPIKTIGLHTIPVALHPEVEVTVTINVARNADEAERQARGEDVTQRREEADEAEEAAAEAEAFFEKPEEATDQGKGEDVKAD